MSDSGKSTDTRHDTTPEEPGRPTPTIRQDKDSAWYALKSTFTKFGSDDCTDIAAGLTYFAVVAIFPLLLALISLIQLAGQEDYLVPAFEELIAEVAPPEVSTFVVDLLERFLKASGSGIALAIGVVTGLWTASNYVGAFSRAMNRVYGVPEGRSTIRVKALHLFQTLVIVAIIITMLAALVISNPVARWVGGLVGLGDATVQLWSNVRWPLIAVAVIAMVATLYHLGPNVKHPRFRLLSVGSVLAIVLIVLGSLGLGLFVATIGGTTINKTYGALAGAAIAMFYAWLVNVFLLLGAELDAALERTRQLRAGVKNAEHKVQLPPRSTKASDKALAKEAELAQHGARIRERARSGNEGLQD